MDTLPLIRPLAYLDVDTTGLSIEQDRIVRISLLIVRPDGAELRRDRVINPGMPIPPEATEIHGLSDDDVATAPHFGQIARSLAELLEDCDFAGFGIARFDLPILQAEFRRAGVEFAPSRNVVDAMTIFQRKEPHTLANAAKRYTGQDLDPAASVEAVRAVLEAQVHTYDDLPSDVAALSAFCRPPDWIDSEGKLRWVEGAPTIYYGRQYYGRPLREVARLDPGHLDWVIERSNFSAEVKQILREARAGRFPSPPEDHDDESPS